MRDPTHPDHLVILVVAVDIAVAVRARRYLDHLHQQGLVVLTVRYGTTGRPEHRYRWAES